MGATLQLHTGRVPGAYLSGCPQIVRIDPHGYGDYISFTAALAAITDESQAKQYVLVPAPGVYTENITLRRWIHINGIASSGPMIHEATVIQGVGPTTITAPGYDCSIQGIVAKVNSANPAHAGLRLVDDGLPDPPVQPACINCYVSEARGGARATSLEYGALICIVGGHDAYDGGVGLHVEPGCLYLHVGGGGIGSSGDGVSPGSVRGVDADNAFVLLSGGVNVAADPLAGTAIYFYADVPAPLFLENVTFSDALNGVELADDGSAPGPIAVFTQASIRGSMGGGVPVTIGAASTAIVFPGAMSGDLGVPITMAAWVVNGTLIRGDDATWGQGTLATRPVAGPGGPPVGYQYWAANQGPNGMLLVWNGAAWIDLSTGLVVP